MDIAPNILVREHTFNSACAYSAERLEGVPIDGFGLELRVTHHGGVTRDEGEIGEHYDGGVAVLRFTASQARKVHQQLSDILYGDALA
jgi:hypothetical protein